MSNTEALSKALAFIQRHCANIIRTDSRDRDDWAEDMAYVGKVAADALAQQPAASGEPVALTKSMQRACTDPHACTFHRRCLGKCCEPLVNANTALKLRATDANATAQPAPALVPPGWVLVPAEPTRAMLDAAGRCAVQEGQAWLDADARATWAAMLAAAPDAQKGEP